MGRRGTQTPVKKKENAMCRECRKLKIRKNPKTPVYLGAISTPVLHVAFSRGCAVTKDRVTAELARRAAVPNWTLKLEAAFHAKDVRRRALKERWRAIPERRKRAFAHLRSVRAMLAQELLLSQQTLSKSENSTSSMENDTASPQNDPLLALLGL
jgi:hypothetical protein